MLEKLHDWAWDRWHDKADARAMEDPRYAQLYTETLTPEGYHRFTSKNFEEQAKIFSRINPHPWWHKTWMGYVKIKRIWKDVVKFYERGRYGIAKCDVWNLDHHLARIYIRGFAELRDHGVGFPAHMNVEKWHQELNQMIVCFTEYIDNDDLAKLDEGNKLLAKNFIDLWD